MYATFKCFFKSILYTQKKVVLRFFQIIEKEKFKLYNKSKRGGVYE